MHFLLHITNKTGINRNQTKHTVHWLSYLGTETRLTATTHTTLAPPLGCGSTTSGGNKWSEEAKAWADEKSLKEPCGQAVKATERGRRGNMTRGHPLPPHTQKQPPLLVMVYR